MLTSIYLTPEGALKQGLSEDDMRAAVRSGAGTLWVDLFKPTPDEIFVLDEVFGFHPLAIEDCQHVSRHPKLDEYKNYLFIVFLVPNPSFKPGKGGQGEQASNGEEPVQEIDIFLGKNYVVTYRLAALPFLQSLMDRARREPQRGLGRGASLLVHSLLDVAVDQFFAMVATFQERAEETEARIQSRRVKNPLPRVFALRRQVLSLRRQMSDHREMIQRVVRGDHGVVAPEAVPYFRDVLDHLRLIEADLEVCRETIDSARDVYLAIANVRIQEVIRVLTILFTVTLPIALITSFYGMNLKYLPFADHEYGAFITSGIMVLLCAALYVFLRIKDWL